MCKFHPLWVNQCLLLHTQQNESQMICYYAFLANQVRGVLLQKVYETLD